MQLLGNPLPDQVRRAGAREDSWGGQGAAYLHESGCYYRGGQVGVERSAQTVGNRDCAEVVRAPYLAGILVGSLRSDRRGSRYTGHRVGGSFSGSVDEQIGVRIGLIHRTF